MYNQNLFEALQNVCNFIATQSEMQEIIDAIQKDKKEKKEENNNNNMKTSVKYNSGLMLVIPKMTNAPMLFLEWVSRFNAGLNIVHKVILNENNVIKIRLNCSKEQYYECSEYINTHL